MTQGIVSVVKNGEVILKIVAGSDGMNAGKLAPEIKKRNAVLSLEELHSLAIEVGFGCEKCLVVLGKESDFHMTEDDLPPLYRKTFSDPKFNPRWECGLADHVIVVKL